MAAPTTLTFGGNYPGKHSLRWDHAGTNHLCLPVLGEWGRSPRSPVAEPTGGTSPGMVGAMILVAVEEEGGGGGERGRSSG